MERRLVGGRYELHEPLGGSSWRATDTELGREVLVRLGPAASDPGAVLSHESIVRVFDEGEADGERYAVVEYVPGGSLADRGELTDTGAAEVAAALAYAHTNGVAHGSLGADAILFDAEGRAKVAGFRGGDPAADVRAFGALLEEHGSAALAPVAAAALAGDVDAAELLARIGAATPTAEATAAALEELTLIKRPPPTPPAAAPRRWGRAAVVLVALGLAAAGIAAALLATDDTAEAPTTGSLSLQVPTTAPDTTVEQTEAPPPDTTTEQTTTEQTTTAATTETQPTTGTTEPALPTVTTPTVEPPPTVTTPTEPPTTEELPPPTTEVPPAPPTDPGN